MGDDVELKDVKIDAQGWWRTITVIVSLVVGVVVTYYIGREDMKSEHTKMQSDIAVLKAVRVRSPEELSEIFITRREWENSNRDIKEELRYIRDKLDAIYQIQRGQK